MTSKKSNRREQILQALAHMLETNPGKPITIAKLAAEVGVSEAALYRHFPSKARMFEGLLDFIEETLFSRINKIMEDEKDTLRRCQLTLMLVLGFAEHNPGISRLLTGDALLGEKERLRERTSQLYAKLETHFKQVLRERALREGSRFSIDEGILANMLMAYAEGRMSQYVRSEFKMRPTTNFDAHWSLMQAQLREC